MARERLLRGLILLAATSCSVMSVRPALAQTKVVPAPSGASGSALGIPASATGNGVSEQSAAPTPPGEARSENYYGDSPPGTFTNTERTRTDQGLAPSPAASVGNPNQFVATASGPVANGSATMSPTYRSVSIPAVTNDLAENPQESPSALIWITVFTALIIGSIFGLIKWTQPGGVA